MARQRLDVNQAAEALGISTDAVRKRASRGTLDSEKAGDGSLYVWIDNGAPNGTPNGSTPTQAHLDSLQEQIEFLRRELERKDAILLNMTEAMKALPPPEQGGVPQEPRESPTAGAGDAGGVEPRSANEGAQEGTERRSWWRRLLDG